MAKIGVYVKPAPIGSGVVTTDHVIAQGYDFVYLKMGGMLKVAGNQVDGDLILGAGTAYIPPAALTLSTDLTATRTLVAGSDLTLTIAAAGGTAPYSYQWFKNGVQLTGANTAAIDFGAATEAMAGVYHAQVRDSIGKVVMSTACTVTVTPQE